MTNTLLWHSTRGSDRPVYHDDTRCPEGGAIELQYRRTGDGGRNPCPHCAQFLIATMAARLRGPVLPESDVHRCPTCHSDRIARGKHRIVSDGVVVRREYQCAACEGAFWVRADGAPLNPRPDAA